MMALALGAWGWAKAAFAWLREHPEAMMLILVCILFAAAFQSGRMVERRQWKAAAAEAAQKAIEAARAADTKAVERRAAGAAAVAQERKEVNDAVSQIPDQPTSARQRARACVELRRQGASAPAC